MRRGLKLPATGFVIALGLGTLAAAHAAPEANTNQCWGDVTTQFAQDGTLGEHASSPPGFVPGEGGRQGVGNVSKDNHAPAGTEPGTGGALAGGAQGEHAIAVGERMGFTCDGTPGNPPPETP